MKFQKLTLIFTCLLLFAFSMTTWAGVTGLNNPEKTRMEQQMSLAFELWYAQHPEMKDNARNGDTNSLQMQGKHEGVIRGQVKDNQGTALKAYVFYWTPSMNNQSMNGAVTTDASGNYEITGLASGLYFLAAVANGYLTEFYNEVSDFNQATPIQLGEKETAVADFSLSPSNLGGGSIAGTVKNETGTKAIAGAWILAARADNPFNFYFAASDDNGGFQLVGLPLGRYVLYAQAIGYISEFYDGAHTLLQAKPILVQQTAVTGINFTLVKGGSIAGLVVDGTGAPISGVKVTALPQGTNDMPNIPFISLRWQTSLTNAKGEYQVMGLKDTKYIVSATLNPGQGSPLVLFYDNTYNWEDAKAIEVIGGQDITGINFKFEATEPTGIISGTVKDVDGNPLAGIGVSAWASKGQVFYGHIGRWNYAKTDEKGQYTITNLWPGEYVVSATRWDWWDFTTIYYDGVKNIEDATPVKVETNKEVPNINFTFEKGREFGSITGTVLLETDNSPVAFAIVQASPNKAMFEMPNVRPIPALITYTDKAGNYVLDQLAEGEYKVSVIKSGYEEFYNDKTDPESADLVKVVSGETTGKINFMIPALPETGSRISGTVTDEATGTAITGAFVGVFSKMSRNYHLGNLDYFMTATDDNGQYIVAGIPDGDYVVTCWARDYIAEFYDNTMNPMAAKVFELDGKNVFENINFALNAGMVRGYLGNGEGAGSISGAVLDDQGELVSGAYVYAYNSEKNVVASEMTSTDGTYVLSGLESGNYEIMVARMPYALASENAKVGENGQWNVSGVDFTLSPTGVTESAPVANTVPKDFALKQNYPNPFNPTTNIRYAIPVAGQVKLQIINLQGQVVRTLINGVQAAREYQIQWDGTNDLGQKVASGIYLYRLQAGDFSRTMRLILMK